MPRTPWLLAAAAVLLLLVPSSAVSYPPGLEATKISSAKVCGAAECREVSDPKAATALAVGPLPRFTDAPKRALPWYRSTLKIRAEDGVFWPCPAVEGGHHPGTPRLFADTFAHPDGRARLVPVEYTPPAEEPTEQYPFRLTTGRVVYHYLSGTQTRRLGFRNRRDVFAGRTLGTVDGLRAQCLAVTSRQRHAVHPFARVAGTSHVARKRDRAFTKAQPIEPAPHAANLVKVQLHHAGRLDPGGARERVLEQHADRRGRSAVDAEVVQDRRDVRVDPFDARGGERRPREGHVEQPARVQIVDEPGLSGQQARILQPPDRRARPPGDGLNHERRRPRRAPGG